MNSLHALYHYEAGNHPLPHNPLEIEAALKAGQHSWQVCPYYNLRYSQRGERFTRSDSGYLVTLVQENFEIVIEKVSWLGNVLANRRMPTWLLEQHLRILYKELCAVLPENQHLYEKLLLSADVLTKNRIAKISDEKTIELITDFQKLVAAEDWAMKLPEAGMLVVSAVADEANDINSVPSLFSWLTDTNQFSNSWISEVESLLLNARKNLAN